MSTAFRHLTALLLLAATLGAATVSIEGESFKGLSFEDYVTPKGGQWFSFANVSFTGATAIVLRAARDGAATMEFRLDSPTGTKVGQVTVNTGGWRTFADHTATLSGVSGTHTLYVVATGAASTSQAVCLSVRLPGTGFDRMALYCDGMESVLRSTDYFFVSLQNAWAKYPGVDLGSGVTGFRVRAANGETGTLILRRDSTTGPIIGTVNIPRTAWRTFANYTGTVTGSHSGVHDLYLVGSGAHGGVVDTFSLDTTTGGGGDVLPPATMPADGTLFVSPLGSDGNNGSWASPFRTIQKAATVAVPGDVVYIRQGTYRETVRPARSGDATHPIIYRGMPGETVVVSGADLVTGWTVHSGRIYKSPALAWSMPRGTGQVFVNGMMMTTARFPNSSDILAPTLKKLTANPTRTGNSISFTDATLTQPANFFNGATLVAWWYKSRAQSALVTSFASGGRVTAALDTTEFSPTSDHPYFFADNLNLLDTAGEFYVDPVSRVAYVWCPGDADPNTQVMEVKRRENAFDLSDRAYITIEDLGVRAATITTELGLDGGNGAATWNGVTAHDITLRHLDLYALSHFTALNGGWLWNPMTKATGLVMAGHHNSVLGCTIDWSAGSAIEMGGGPGNRVIGNTITNVAYSGACSVISMGAADMDDGQDQKRPMYSQGGEVGYNTINRFGTNGIGFAGMLGGRVHHNLMTNGVLLADDQGAMYAWNQDLNRIEIDHNIIDKMGGVISWHPNRIGIYLDGRCRNAVLHHNIVSGCTKQLQFSGTSSNYPVRDGWRSVYNNTFIGAIYAGYQDTDGHANTYFVNNLCTGGKDSFPTRPGVFLLPENQWSSVTLDADKGPPSGSPLIDAGRVLPGYTDGFLGAKPDIGARERGAPVWQAGAGAMPADYIDRTLTVHTFPAVADATLSEQSPTTPAGSASYLDLDDNSNARQAPILRFQVSGLAGRQIESIELVVQESDQAAAGDVPFHVMQAAGTWSEGGVTWNTAPPTALALPGTTVTQWSMGSYSPGVHGDGAWWDQSVGENAVMNIRLEPRWYAGDGAYSFILQPVPAFTTLPSNANAVANQPRLRLRSREAGSGAPYLRIVTSGGGSADTPPTMSAIANQTTAEDTARSVNVTISDAETAVSALTLTATSSNSTLLPTAGIVFSGTTGVRTATLTPAADQHGTATITLTVTDGGGLSATRSFILTVTAVNDPPTLSEVANQYLVMSQSTGPLPVTVGDRETAAASLTLVARSSNTGLVPTTGLVLGGSGANRTITVNPASGKTGSATITLTVSDGSATAARNFTVTVSKGDLPAGTSSQDIGSVGVPGSVSGDGSSFTIAGSGADIWNQADAFRFVWQTVNGDFDHVTRVESQTDTHAWAKAGLMLRSSTAADAAHVSVFITPGNGAAFQYRIGTAGANRYIAGPKVAAPTWLKLSRRGSRFSAYQSADGSTWKRIATRTLTLPTNALAGLAVTSHHDGLLSTAVFSHCLLTPVASN